MKSINQSNVDYNNLLNYKLLTKNLLIYMQLFGALIVDLKSLKITRTQRIYSYLTLFLAMYHMYITPEMFLKIKYKLQEFNHKASAYHYTLGILFPIIIDATAILSKITVYRMQIFLKTFYNYLYLSDVYINFNKSSEHNLQNKRAEEGGPYSCWYKSNIRNHNFKNKNANGNSQNEQNGKNSDGVMCLFKEHHNKVCNYGIVIFICLVLPANIIRVYELVVNTEINVREMCFILFMYWQNYFIGSVELQFVIICYSIYLRYCEINIMLENILEKHHKPMLEFMTGGRLKVHVVDVITVDNFDTVEHKIIRDTPLESVNFEYIRMSHLFLSEAYTVLNNIFKFQIIFSLTCSFAISLLDLYYEFFGNDFYPSRTHTNVKIYWWIIQYFVRFASIVIVAHKTTMESLRTKIIVTSLNNQYLHIDTQEQLNLFLRQVDSREMGFSAGGLFTLSTPLITSAVAAGVTYLVVLIQFHNELISQENPQSP